MELDEVLVIFSLQCGEYLNWKLCYVSGDTAYFTPQEMDEVWGDDWNDVPYEHNAGVPYGDSFAIKFDADFYYPCDGHLNSPFNVQYINENKIAWLTKRHYTNMHGDWEEEEIAVPGMSLLDFVRAVDQAGGKIYVCIN